VRPGADSRRVVQPAHRDHDEAARLVAPGQARSALCAEHMRESRGLRRFVRSQLVVSLSEAKPVDGDEEVRGERGAAALSTAGAMAIVSPRRILRDLVTHAATKAATSDGHDSPPRPSMSGAPRARAAHPLAT